MKIVVVSHDATRTGAPILLLNLTKAVKSKSNHAISFLLKNGGDILNEFSSLAPTTIASNPLGLFSKIIARYFPFRIINYNKYSEKKYNKYSRKKVKAAIKDADLVLSNTITNGDLLPMIREYFKGPIISYVHEMEMAANFFSNENDIKNLVELSEHFLVPSLAVKNFLLSSFKIPENKISLLRYYIPEMLKSEQIPIETEERKLHDSFLIGAAGTTDWRKGCEVFIIVAKMVCKKLPQKKIKFLWKGSGENGIELKRLQYDVRKSGISENFLFMPSGSDMTEFYNNLHLFFLSSREDPYPLVVLEAASAGIPSICFKESGGATEFIQNDAGTSLDYLDIDEAVQTIVNYYNDEEKRREEGQIAKKRVQEWHQQPEIIVHQLNDIIAKINLSDESN